ALGDHFFRQSEGVRLEWVERVRALAEDARTPCPGREVVAHQLADHRLGVAVAKMEPVAGAVALESARPIARLGEAADLLLLLDQSVARAVLQMVGARKTGE